MIKITITIIKLCSSYLCHAAGRCRVSKEAVDKKEKSNYLRDKQLTVENNKNLPTS
jgi:NADH:ubiquinone oxidoreductase subunit E